MADGFTVKVAQTNDTVSEDRKTFLEIRSGFFGDMFFGGLF